MYEEYGLIREYIDSIGWDLKLDELLVYYNARKSGHKFSKQEHCKAIVLSMLSANRPWVGIERNLDKLEVIFGNYNPDVLRDIDPIALAIKVQNIGCGNRRIWEQMEEVPYNIQVLDDIEKQFGDVDAVMQVGLESPETVLWVLSNNKSKFKFKGLGQPLVAQYMKYMGIDIIKPDIHITRILGRWGYSDKAEATTQESFDICHDIAKQYNITQSEVGAVLWQYCATGYMQICDAHPDCNRCPAKNVCSYGKSPFKVK